MCDSIVVTRPGYDPGKAEAGRVAPTCDVRGLSSSEISAVLDNDKECRTFFTDAAMTDISATAIRTAVRRGDHEELIAMVPESVAAYIEKHGLYRK